MWRWEKDRSLNQDGVSSPKNRVKEEGPVLLGLSYQ